MAETTPVGEIAVKEEHGAGVHARDVKAETDVASEPPSRKRGRAAQPVAAAADAAAASDVGDAAAAASDAADDESEGAPPAPRRRSTRAAARKCAEEMRKMADAEALARGDRSTWKDLAADEFAIIYAEIVLEVCYRMYYETEEFDEIAWRFGKTMALTARVVYNNVAFFNVIDNDEDMLAYVEVGYMMRPEDEDDLRTGLADVKQQVPEKSYPYMYPEYEYDKDEGFVGGDFAEDNVTREEVDRNYTKARVDMPPVLERWRQRTNGRCVWKAYYHRYPDSAQGSPEDMGDATGWRIRRVDGARVTAAWAKQLREHPLVREVNQKLAES